jgi:hypothetical protein
LGKLALLETHGGEVGEELAAEGFVFLAVFPGHEDGLAGEAVPKSIEFAAEMGAVDPFEAGAALVFWVEMLAGDSGGFLAGCEFGVALNKDGFELITLGLDILPLKFRTHSMRHSD